MKNNWLKIIVQTQLLLLPMFAMAQTVGTKISFVGVDGKTYTGVVQELIGNMYKVKYDGYNYTAVLGKNQITIIENNSGNQNTQSNITVGTKVSIIGVNGVTYTAVIKEINSGKYKVRYDGYNNEEWILRTQFTINGNTVTTNNNTPATQNNISTTTVQNTISPDVNGLKAIFEFGRQKGWAGIPHINKFDAFLKILNAADTKKVVVFLQQATTASARFFALKSLLTGDSYPVVQKFIEQLNQHPESYQQENCLVTNHRSIIQQWEFSCSVTAVQTYLADLCPRYAWEVKQIPHYDADAHDPHHPMAEQQKLLLEKYGGATSPRGDYSGKSIAINGALDELVGPILGVKFYTQKIAEPLPIVFGKIRSLMDRGIDVPLLITFMGTDARHFLLAMRYRQTANGYQYLIYDPWDGVCDYVNESSILQNSLSPLLTQWKISLDYYYPVQ